MKKNWISGVGLFLLVLSNLSFAHEVFVDTLDGELFVFDVDPADSLQNLQEKIEMLVGDKSSTVCIELVGNKRKSDRKVKMNAKIHGSYLGYPRDYFADLRAEEKGDIRFIVTTLANKNVWTIALVQDDLTAAGDRIDHLHPLRFLATVFSDEELKVSIRNIRGKGLIWHRFLGGLKDCLTTEAKVGNLREEMILHFAQTVNVNPALIRNVINAYQWDDFIDVLITYIPRQGDQDRYDT